MDSRCGHRWSWSRQSGSEVPAGLPAAELRRGMHLSLCWILICLGAKNNINNFFKSRELVHDWENHWMTVICFPSREMKFVNLSYFNQHQVYKTNCYRSLLLRGLMTVSWIHLFFSSLVSFQKSKIDLLSFTPKNKFRYDPHGSISNQDTWWFYQDMRAAPKAMLPI